MRGDHAPPEVDVVECECRFRDGVVTVMDDSHGVAAYGATGGARRTLQGAGGCLHRHLRWAFGVNGGFVALANHHRGGPAKRTHTSTNPLGAADCGGRERRGRADGTEAGALQPQARQFPTAPIPGSSRSAPHPSHHSCAWSHTGAPSLKGILAVGACPLSGANNPSSRRATADIRQVRRL
jgi:glycine C-acetyltransferase